MKKKYTVIILVIICTFAFVLSGCSKELVSKDEFYIYEGKEVAATMESYDVSSFDFIECMGQDGALPGKVLSTKRGITIGSTAKDVAKKYRDVAVMVTDADVIYYEDFDAYMDGKNPNDIMCVVVIAGKVDGDGVVNIMSEEEAAAAGETLYLVIYIDDSEVYNISTLHYNEDN